MKKTTIKNIVISIIILISIIISIYHIIIIYSRKQNDKIYNISKYVLETLYTSDSSRYERHLKLNEQSESFAASNVFFPSNNIEEYIELYKNNCTNNCLINMNNSALFTYVDYLCFLSQTNVYFKSMNLIEKDIQQHNNLYKSKEFYYTVTLLNNNNEEFEVHGEICGSFIENEYKIYFLTLSDYHSLSIHITGRNIFQHQ